MNIKTQPIKVPSTHTHTDRSQVDPQIIQAAEGMEALFLDYMMKVMRQTIPKNEMDLESSATRIYRSLMDSEYATKAAQVGGIGLAEQIINYLTLHQSTPVQNKNSK